MLSIRFQRTGRKGQAKFRVVVQESRQTPTSGRVVANLGHYDPHSKDHGVDFDRLQVYMKNGAQPSTRVIHLLSTNKIDLPAWVKVPVPRQRLVRHPDKLRRNRPAEELPAKAAVDEPTPETEEAVSEAKDSEVVDQPVADDAPDAAEQTDSTNDGKQETKDQSDEVKTDDEAPAGESEPALEEADKATKDQPVADVADQSATDATKDKPAAKDDDSQ